MGRFTQIVLLLCLAAPAWGQGTNWQCPDRWDEWPCQGTVRTPPDVPGFQFQPIQSPGIPRAEVQELRLAYQEWIRNLEAHILEDERTIRSLQVQLASERDWSGALQEHNKVLGELAGGKKRGKLDWIWLGVEVGATLFTACELSSLC